MNDILHRFIFQELDVRGQVIRLSDSCQQMINNHQYPDFIKDLLIQSSAINALLAATLKFEGKISLQLQSKSGLKSMLVQTNNQLQYRGLVHFDDSADFSNISFQQIAQNGQMVITIVPNQGKRYQGIVPMNGNSLAECIEYYFAQSEQLNTRLKLFCKNNQVIGVMLQALPEMKQKENFEHLDYLLQTLEAEEAFEIDHDTLMMRLFHQESLSNLMEQNVSFNCDCSREKMLDAVLLLDVDEIADSLSRDGEIAVTCEFCLSSFSFSDVDLKKHQSITGNQTKH
ncbi:MAG: Hsp33 family molecular chaperone HslO [Gammaproteobacteria bacterium]|nr:Hsp33 family molecular chaperone HslO [Gammaproteobacteria bacterium]